MSHILIVAEQKEGKLRSASFNAFTFGQKMAEASGGGEITALVLGTNMWFPWLLLG